MGPFSPLFVSESFDTHSKAVKAGLTDTQVIFHCPALLSVVKLGSAGNDGEINVNMLGW